MFTRLEASDIRETYDCGVSLAETAALFGTTIYALRRLFAVMGHPLRRGRLSLVDDRRVCSRCGKCKLLERFRRDASRPGGYSYVCRKCLSLRTRAV